MALHTSVSVLIIAVLLTLSGCGPASVPTSGPTITLSPPAKTLSRVPALETVDTQMRARDGMVMVYVPAGQFEMGLSDFHLDQILQECNQGENDCQRDWFKDEQPAHTVAVDAFWIDQTEVTNEQFAVFLNERGNQSEEVADAEFARWLGDHHRYSSVYDGEQGQVYWLEPGRYGLIEQVGGQFRPRSGHEDYPVIEVSWAGAAAYCEWVGGRLPTEAEWEYAARGPGGPLYPWGDTFDGSQANYCDASCSERGRDAALDDGQAEWAPVGGYPEGASWCGALDMAGNVWEWVNDWHADRQCQRAAAKNPQGPDTGTLRIRRGGSWYDQHWAMRSTSRRAEFPSSLRAHWVGFRCAVAAKP